VISTDAYEALPKAYDKEVAKRLYESVLALGNTTDQEDAYRSLGRDPKSDALMRARGFDSFKAENKIIENGIQFNKRAI
jgi:peptidyl-dipeptidase Dcp